MSLMTIDKDFEQFSMTVTTEYDATAERAWQLWADPRQLERWWGPPTWPATVTAHDLIPGGRVDYVMAGPEGELARGYWHVLQVEPPRLLVVEDGFADGSGAPDPALPTTLMRVQILDRDGGGVLMSISSMFASLEAMEQVIAMGMEEGLSQALGQIGALLGEDRD